MTSLLSRATIATAALAMITACSAAPSRPHVSPVAASVVIAGALVEARAEGASDQQIAVLEQAAARGEVTYEDVQTVVGDTQECLEDAGFTMLMLEPEPIAPGSTLLLPSYQIIPPSGMTEADQLIISDSCQITTSKFVLSAYSSQPEAVEAQMEQWNVPEVRECLKERGYDVDEDATGYDINMIVYEDLQLHSGESGYTVCTPDSPYQ